MVDFPMKQAPGPNATMLEQLRWAQQEAVRLNQGKDRLTEEVERQERLLRETRQAFHGLQEQNRSLQRTATQALDARDRARESRKRGWRELAAARKELADEQARTEKRITEWRGIADRLHAERVQARSDVRNLEAKLVRSSGEHIYAFPVTRLEKEMQKTIEALKMEGAEKTQTIRKQGNRIKQYREARNLWRDRAKDYLKKLDAAEGSLALWRKAGVKGGFIPAERVAEAERALKKRVKKALKGEL